MIVDNQIGSGSDLAALYAELDAAYRATVIELIDAGATPAGIRAPLFEKP